MARTRSDSSDCTPLRLRIPASLAVVVMGTSATVVMTFAACEVTPMPPPPELDAGQLSKVFDGGLDSAVSDGNGQADDATTPGPADAPPDTPQG